MRELLAFVFTILLANISLAQSNTDTLTIKLEEIPTINIDCGTIAVGGVFGFKTCSNKLYHIIVSCPETYGKDFFQKGKEYELVLTKDLTKIKSYYIVNLPASSTELYFALLIRKQVNNF